MKQTQLATTKREPRAPQQLVQAHMAFSSFVELTIPKGTISVSINDNFITDFVGMEPSQTIEYLCIDRNPIISFRGFPNLPNLTNLSILGSPISKLSNFRALAVVAAGQQLKVLNGSDVTSNDRAAALAYGPPDAVCQLIIRGWLPKRPVSFPARSLNSTNPNNENIQCRILKIVNEQENDPVTVRITRVLRAQGYGIPQIREFLRDFFSPHSPKSNEGKQTKVESSIEIQIRKQQQIIDVLAAQLQALRSGNRTFNDYDNMIKTSGASLLKNAEMLRKSENNNVDNQMKATKTKRDNKEEYELLRQAVVDFLQADENEEDEVLIQNLNSIHIDSDENDTEGEEIIGSNDDDDNEYTEETILPLNETEENEDDEIIPHVAKTDKKIENDFADEEERKVGKDDEKKESTGTEKESEKEEVEEIEEIEEMEEVGEEEEENIEKPENENETQTEEDSNNKQKPSDDLDDDDDTENDKGIISSIEEEEEEEEDILSKMNKIFEEEDEEEMLDDISEEEETTDIPKIKPKPTESLNDSLTDQLDIDPDAKIVYSPPTSGRKGSANRRHPTEVDSDE